MRGGRVLPVGRSVSDVAGNNDQRGPIIGRLGRLESALDGREVVGIADPQHIPAVGGKARAHVLGESDHPPDKSQSALVLRRAQSHALRRFRGRPRAS